MSTFPEIKNAESVRVGELPSKKDLIARPASSAPSSIASEVVEGKCIQTT